MNQVVPSDWSCPEQVKHRLCCGAVYVPTEEYYIKLDGDTQLTDWYSLLCLGLSLLLYSLKVQQCQDDMIFSRSAE